MPRAAAAAAAKPKKAIIRKPSPALSRLKKLRGEMDGYAGSTHNVQWGDHLCYKVAGKLFAILGRDHDNGGAVSMSIKTTPAAFRAQTKRPSVTQAPYLAKKQWIRVGDVAAIPWPELRDWVMTSYELVVAGLPKGVRESLSAPVRS